jgi:hypothetical protein
MNKQYIGITGVARSGKNLFCDISRKVLKEQYGLSSNSYALAYFLKQDCEDFVKNKLGLDVFSEKTEDKQIFRELLVWYGAVKRKQSEGRYWTGKLKPFLEIDKSDVVFVTDIRYDFYEKDERYWIQNELNGKLIHISKYSYGFPSDGRRLRPDIANTASKIYVHPPNEHEAVNDPKIKVRADIRFEWEHVYTTEADYNELINNSILNIQVSNVYKRLFEGL